MAKAAIRSSYISSNPPEEGGRGGKIKKKREGKEKKEGRGRSDLSSSYIQQLFAEEKGRKEKRKKQGGGFNVGQHASFCFRKRGGRGGQGKGRVIITLLPLLHEMSMTGKEGGKS